MAKTATETIWTRAVTLGAAASLALCAGCASCDGGGPTDADGDGDVDGGEDADVDGDGGEDGGPSCEAPCVDDARCVAGRCEPWGDGAVDGLCRVDPEPFAVTPRVLCHWPRSGVAVDEGPEEWRWARRVASTVVGATFTEAPGELVPPPTWLVFATGSVLSSPTEAGPAEEQRPGGVLRVLDPESCTLVDTLDEAPVAAWFQPPAVGDLDGDGRPEIVAQAWRQLGEGTMSYQSSGELVAWSYDPAEARFRVSHRSSVGGAVEADLVYTAAYQQMSGPTIADLDDDGSPEVLLAGRAYDAELHRLTGQAPPVTPLMMSRQPGPGGVGGGPFITQQDIVADLDGDGRAELVYGHAIFSWTGSGWEPAPFFDPPEPLGVAHAALADLGELPGSEEPGAVEVVAVGYDGVRIQSLDGRVLARFDLPTGERGGSAPSVANLDEDPTPEILVGVDQGLFVYDLQCDGEARGPECGRDAGPAAGLPPLPRGVRWADRPPAEAWDFMGATTFDFDGDGRLEVVYADECFLRVYDGPTGEVLYSHWRPSRTASEVPIVLGASAGADTVLAVGLHTAAFCSQATGAEPYDPQFPGLSCRDDRDCFGPAGSCRAGRCRCASSDECCAGGSACEATGFACHAAPPGDGEGRTCRAVRVPDPSAYSVSGALEEGIDVLTDAFGRWSPARPIWSQDAYSVTNVLDDGTIPATSEVVPSWVAGTGLRSNVAGAASTAAAADLTARSPRVECEGGEVASLVAEVCDRGTRAAPEGLVVRFSAGGETLCDARTAAVLLPGECLEVRCTPAPAAPSGLDLTATANPDGRTPECGDLASNESAAIPLVCE